MSWNPAAERMDGYAATEAIGQDISILVPIDRENEISELLGQYDAEIESVISKRSAERRAVTQF